MKSYLGIGMPEQGTDFLQNYQALMREGWETWSRQAQASHADPANAASFAGMGDPAIMARMLDGLKDYTQWMQAMAQGQPTGSDAPWPPMPAGFSGMPPFAQMPGAEPVSAASIVERIESWLKLSRELLGMPAFGVTREQQEDHQALMRAAVDYAEQYSRYQSLLARVHARGAEALQQRLAESGNNVDIESLRALYDLWVQLTEEAYAETALSAEFREVYAALVNAQMHLRALQQRQVERVSTELGVPTRGEVNSLGERLQATRRELRSLATLSRKLAGEVALLKAVKTATPGKEKPAASAPIKRATPKKAAVKKPAVKKSDVPTPAPRKSR
jgi:class III poly(R)-hydroxyalkanoic acid synthase PhaE subunit